MSERMTCVFDYNVRDFPANPLFADTPFGKPFSITAGDLAAKVDEQESENKRLREALAIELGRLTMNDIIPLITSVTLDVPIDTTGDGEVDDQESMTFETLEQAEEMFNESQKEYDSGMKLEEPILPDTYPVFPTYWYVVDGNPIRSEIEGTVDDLRRRVDGIEIRRCDAVGRGLPI